MRQRSGCSRKCELCWSLNVGELLSVMWRMSGHPLLRTVWYSPLVSEVTCTVKKHHAGIVVRAAFADLPLTINSACMHLHMCMVWSGILIKTTTTYLQHLSLLGASTLNCGPVRTPKATADGSPSRCPLASCLCRLAVMGCFNAQLT
eukprot:1157691-Pelagomonas_calceolata.AAC.4